MAVLNGNVFACTTDIERFFLLKTKEAAKSLVDDDKGL